MAKVWMIAAALSLFASAALAQGGPRDRDDDSRDWYGGRGGWERGSERPRGSMRDERPMMMHRDDHDDDRGRDGGQTRGARFFLRNGEARIYVVCGNRESTQACVDAALRLLDRAQTQQGTAPRSAPPPNAPTPQ